MGETEEFDTLTFEKRLATLKDTQESIQALSSWCLKQRAHHKKIVASWLNVLKRVKMEQRLVLFYLANDVIQYSKRKNLEFVESWGLNLQKATPLVRDEKVRPKILRIFKIWEQRSVYDDEFLSDLTGLLSAGAVKKTDDDPLDFQPQQLVNKIKQCSVLEADTDLRLKYIHESRLELSDADALCASLKEKRNKEEVEKDLNEGIGCVERYTQALQREIVAREALLALLASAGQYYSTQRGEVKVVAYAYKNFGSRVRALKRKLDELIPSLASAAPSPPRRDEDVPSPGPDEDLDLPNTGDTDATDAHDVPDDETYNIDKTFNTSLAADGSLYNLGLSSFLTSDNPMAIFNDSDQMNNSSANKIEVINSRPSSETQDFNINDFLKTLIPNDSNVATSDNNSVTSATMSQKSQDALPGLDLLTPDSTGNPPPPTSFYGTMDSISDEVSPQPYHTEPSSTWNTAPWTVPPQSTAPPRVLFADTPESPPPAPLPPPSLIPDVYTQDLPPADVDHRGLLPPPPPPPVLPSLPVLGHMEDVDHRMLPSLPPPPPPVTVAPTRHPAQQDVDHRNLIPLTHQPPPAPPRPLAARQPPPAGDQDYRVAPMVAPSDIVESVDMDLSEDEEQHGMYSNQHSQPDAGRRPSFNNNKVLVGGHNGKTNHTNLIRINSLNEDTVPYTDKRDGPPPQQPASAPAPLAPMSNPFDALPDSLKNFNARPEPRKGYGVPTRPYPRDYDDDSDESAAPAQSRELRNPSPPGEWTSPHPQRPHPGQRFPRHWGPRVGFRPPGFPHQQHQQQHQQQQQQHFWPRNNGPRPPNRWMGPRPQRFW